MKDWFTVALLGCLLLLSSQLEAQSEERVVWGVIKDQQTLQAVPTVHVVVAQRGTFTDHNGFFSIEAKATDTVVLSHVNYQPIQVVAPAAVDTLFLLLASRDLLLREVVVRGLSTERQFKRQILGVRLPPSQEEINAQANVAIAQKLYLAGYVPLMDSRDNYQWQLQEPKEVTLFSSGPTKGLPKALKDLFRSNQLQMPSRKAMPDTNFSKEVDPFNIIQP